MITAPFYATFGRPPLPKAIDQAIVEKLVELALTFDDPQRVLDAIGPITIRDGYARRRLSLVDCREVVTFTRHARASVKGKRAHNVEEGRRISELERLLLRGA